MVHRAPDESATGGGPYTQFLQVWQRFVPAGYVTSLIRTWVPVGIGSTLAWLALHFRIVVSASGTATVATVCTAGCIAGYYALARLVERRWPTIGRWLVALNLVDTAPVYAAATETVRLLDTRTGDVRRVAPVRRPERSPYSE